MPCGCLVSVPHARAMTAGDIYTIGGVPGDDGNQFSGDGGPALQAEFGSPAGIATDRAGDMLIADQGNSRVRMIPAGGGTFFGRGMKAGDGYTVAGDGTTGFSGLRGRRPGRPRRSRLPGRHRGHPRGPVDRRQQAGPDDFWLTAGGWRRDHGRPR
jgi:hypothetical protein